MASYQATLSGLATPRRALPIAAVALALIAVQAGYGPPRAGLVPLGMTVAFVALGPWTWRAVHRRSAGLAIIALAGEAVASIAALGLALPGALAIGPTFLTDPGSLAIAGVLHVVGSWGLGRDIELEQDLAHVRLKALRTHLDPHFLFNTLNAIMEWCAEDPRVAEDAIGRLAQMLRSTLEALEQPAWPLGRELEVVGDLLELHRIRDLGAFTTAIECDPAARAVAVPPLLVVSLVENAVKHGPRAGHRGEIAVRVAHAGGRLTCTVTNPGRFAPRAAGRGLATLRSRLALAYGPRASFAIGGTGEAHTRAVLELAA